MILQPSDADPAGRSPADGRPYLDTLNRAVTCPDCTSDVIVRDATRGLVTLTVIHADGCPWLKAAAIGQPRLLIVHRDAELDP